MTEGSPLLGDRGRFFVAWLQEGAVFRQFCNFADMHPYSSSLIPTRVTEGSANVVDYDVVSSPLDSAVILATVESDQSIRVLRISFAPAESDLMRVDEILRRRTDLLRSGTSFANVTISSVFGESSDGNVRYMVAWPELHAIRFLLLAANGRVLYEDQIRAETSTIRSAYDPVNRRFLVVFSSGAVVASAVIFPNGTSGGVTNIGSGNVRPPVPPGPFTVVEDGKTFRIFRSLPPSGHGRILSAVTATGAAEPSFRVAFWEWMYVTERRQQVIAGRPGGFVPPQPPPVTRCFQRTQRLYTLGLDGSGSPVGDKRPHGPDFGCGSSPGWGTALSRDARVDQLLISPTGSHELQVEFVP
ncbi:MAG TPA: hypothetical protein VNJ70_14215 [Thermoanaerobaculia bacterium]|nr:hypothetical protein [Thermoanaerobaculia bacterium]